MAKRSLRLILMILLVGLVSVPVAAPGSPGRIVRGPKERTGPEPIPQPARPPVRRPDDPRPHQGQPGAQAARGKQRRPTPPPAQRPSAHASPTAGAAVRQAI